MDVRDVERALRESLAAAPQRLIAAYLFGSVARTEAREGSDVDVAILCASAPSPSLQGLPLALEAALEKRLGAPVQVVVLNTAPVDLVHRVLRDGRLLLDADPSARIRFEIRARNEYFDLEPALRRYRSGGAEAP